MGTNFVEAQSVVGDLLSKQENIKKKIAETIAEACAERGQRGQANQTLVKDVNNILAGVSPDEKVIILEWALMYLVKLGTFSGKSSGKGRSSSDDDYGDLFSRW